MKLYIINNKLSQIRKIYNLQKLLFIKRIVNHLGSMW